MNIYQNLYPDIKESIFFSRNMKQLRKLLCQKEYLKKLYKVGKYKQYFFDHNMVKLEANKQVFKAKNVILTGKF